MNNNNNNNNVLNNFKKDKIEANIYFNWKLFKSTIPDKKFNNFGIWVSEKFYNSVSGIFNIDEVNKRLFSNKDNSCIFYTGLESKVGQKYNKYLSNAKENGFADVKIIKIMIKGERGKRLVSKLITYKPKDKELFINRINYNVYPIEIVNNH